MNDYKELAQEVINNKEKQDELIQKLLLAISEWWYTWVIIFCWNYLLGINKKGDCIPCIPEVFMKNWNVIDKDGFDLCQKMNTERFDTNFSLFSLRIWLELFSKTSIKKQLLLSADDKYVEENEAINYFLKSYNAIPEIYREEIEKHLWWEDKTKEHLKRINWVLYDRKNNKGKYNDYLISEKFLVRRFIKRQKRSDFLPYKEYYHNLWKNFTSCSIEIFHLLTMINENKTNIFDEIKTDNKIAMIMFIPDACVSSAMQWWLAVSKTDENFEVINVTQTTIAEDGIIMITKITKDWVSRV